MFGEIDEPLAQVALSAVVVPFGAVVSFAVIVTLDVVQVPVKVSLCCNKFHGTTSTNPTLFMRVPLDARVNDKSPAPFVGISEYTTSSLYPLGISTSDACPSKGCELRAVSTHCGASTIPPPLTIRDM